MRYFILFLLSLTFTQGWSQNNFEITLNASHFYVGDSLILSAPEIRSGFQDLYSFQLETNEYVKDAREMTGFSHSGYYITFEQENILKGNIDDPVPVAFIFIDPLLQKLPKITNVFYIDKGTYTINLSDELVHKADVYIDSPVNNECRHVRELLDEVYLKANNPFEVDSLINFEKKQEILASYILENPNSYVALWEIIKDYSQYSKHPGYADNLSRLSAEMKNTTLFKNFESKLIAEGITQVGNTFPDIEFDNDNTLNQADFADYSITLIDYWAISCGPCIRAMPKLVAIHNEYKNKGLNVISVADEKYPDRMKKAEEILAKNKATWQTHFDFKDDFKKKVNATAYPLIFLVDGEGKIMFRGSNVDKVREIIENRLN